MRGLTRKQKKILDEWYVKNKQRLLARGGIIFYDISEDDEFSHELFEELERIHDTEILSQEINRYISDKGNDDIHSYSSGGVVQQTGFAKVHRGELVIPANVVKRVVKTGAYKKQPRGKGWRNYDKEQPKRHSNAVRYGRAGGNYKG